MTTRINILPDELQLAAGVLSLPNIFEIKYSAPVRLYKAANNNQWSYANSYGILTVTLVEKQSVVMIRLVDLKSKSVTMEQECYEGFDYQTLSSNFHAFESDDGFVGLLFAERFDADQFAKQVCQLIRLKATGSINGGSTPSLPSTKPSVNVRSDSSDSSSPTGNAGSSTAPPTPVKKTSPPPSTPPPVANKPTAVNTSIAASSSVHTTSTSHKEPEKKHTSSNSGGGSSSSGGGGGLFSKIFGTKNKDQIPDRSQIKISGPKVDKFKHVSHIGFDPKSGFTDIPPELKTIFAKAGISEDELKDKKTAKFLMKTLVTVTSDAPPPPSLDVPSGRPQPPPTPGTRSTPPPPPFKGASSNAPSNSSAIGVGGFVPPPPTNVPPPPVVDLSVKPRVSVASPATDSDGGASGGVDMLSEIKNKKLRNVKQEDLPEFKNMAESDQNNLAAKIAGIMELRRGNIEYSSEDEESDDDDWEL
ncbi:wiscott-aldrich syndrome protein [Naegleria gruberi]|uniref:Wiscott-aldrich syndrome protein n=1 Tax=Naegleria gruberi TaxID=5762 RepID=D2VJ26_NAEGR|nr:wiscott-aldrich syndrome protein [Naegleria gruberi]EFC43128.1 wiscott-aldrich syndrome protein [Naegleria gruberi]|eukprot:XP_002675872.1 wiscott-aldrich syndrome protein [Naegleria gruberi strain NEG-M]